MDKPLSYSEMFEIVTSGGAVFLPDRIVRRVEDIPLDEAYLKARADAEARQAARVAEGDARPLLQVLIPTLVTRRHWLKRLMGHLEPQLIPGVEVITMEDDGDRSIGRKRNQLVNEATARYVCFFDDDDLPSPDYVSRVTAELTGPTPPDVVGFKLRYFEDGKLSGYAVHSYDAANVVVQLTSRGMRRMDRLPNHLNPVRVEIARQLGYRDLNTGEDGDYAKRMAQLRPRPREAFVDAYLYDYLYRRPETRKGEVTNELRIGKGRR